jgi:hypothetical protein
MYVYIIGYICIYIIGYLADSIESYVKKLIFILDNHDNNNILDLRSRARDSIERFSDEMFEECMRIQFYKILF